MKQVVGIFGLMLAVVAVSSVEASDRSGNTSPTNFRSGNSPVNVDMFEADIVARYGQAIADSFDKEQSFKHLVHTVMQFNSGQAAVTHIFSEKDLWNKVVQGKIKLDQLRFMVALDPVGALANRPMLLQQFDLPTDIVLTLGAL